MLWFTMAGVAGLGMTVAALLYMAGDALSMRRLRRFQAHTEKGGGKRKRNVNVPYQEIFFGVAGMLVGGALAWGTKLLPIVLPMSGAAGLLAKEVIKRLGGSKRKFKKLKEVAILYESIDLFTRAGYTVRQSLQMSTMLVDVLRPTVEKCLDRWPAGPLRAIRMLGDDIGVPEADVLTGILMHAEEGGTEKIAGIMEQEALRLEDLRRSLAETRVAAKPIYSTIYVFMPVIAAMGMLITPLAYRAFNTIGGMRAAGF